MDVIQKLYGDAPTMVIGDFQEMITADCIDNINMKGRKLKEQGVLYQLFQKDYVSAYWTMYSQTVMATRWNSMRTAGRHIDWHMINKSARYALKQVIVDNEFRAELVLMDHAMVVSNYYIELYQQDVGELHKTRIDYRKLAWIKMKLLSTMSCEQGEAYIDMQLALEFNDEHFQSIQVQEDQKMLIKVMKEANKKYCTEVCLKIKDIMNELERAVKE